MRHSHSSRIGFVAKAVFGFRISARHVQAVVRSESMMRTTPAGNRDPHRARGGNGRHTRLRIWRRKALGVRRPPSAPCFSCCRSRARRRDHAFSISVAQLAAQRSPNPKAEGSTPSWDAIFMWGCPSGPRARSATPLFAGSNPAPHSNAAQAISPGRPSRRLGMRGALRLIFVLAALPARRIITFSTCPDFHLPASASGAGLSTIPFKQASVKVKI